MNKTIVAVLLMSMLVMGASATPRSLKSDTSAEAVEHQRILEELELVSQLRERMLAEG